jgi:sulfate adenylyltransferase
MTQLIEPHGGILCDLLIQGEKLNQLKKDSLHLESVILNDRQLCDIEMLLNGSFSPLIGFLTAKFLFYIQGNLHLSDGKIWPIPITLLCLMGFSKNITIG